MKKKSRIIGVAVGLAVVAVIAFSGVALAAGPTKVTVAFNGDLNGDNGDEPDVTVTAYAPGPPSGPSAWATDATAQFTLNGSSYAVGQITATFLPKALPVKDSPPGSSVEGYYIATGGNFHSQFVAESYMEYGSSSNDHRWFTSSHSIDASSVPYDADDPITITTDSEDKITEITGTGMFISGDATAPYGGGSSVGKTVGAGQFFWGQANSVTVDAKKTMHYPSGQLASPWAEFSATATGTDDSPVAFVGQTEGRCYPCEGELGIYVTRSKQGVGFDIGISGSSIDGAMVVPDEPNRLLETTYPYTNMVVYDEDGNEIDTKLTFDKDQPSLAIIQAFNADRIVGETSTPFTGVPGNNYYEWKGVPGYILP